MKILLSSLLLYIFFVANPAYAAQKLTCPSQITYQCVKQAGLKAPYTSVCHMKTMIDGSWFLSPPATTGQYTLKDMPEYNGEVSTLKPGVYTGYWTVAMQASYPVISMCVYSTKITPTEYGLSALGTYNYIHDSQGKQWYQADEGAYGCSKDKGATPSECGFIARSHSVDIRSSLASIGEY